MGRLVEGKWKSGEIRPPTSGASFRPVQSAFRGKTTEGGETGFKAEPDRYHLYVSLACPLAHRTLVVRKIQKLEGLISVSIVEPVVYENSWEFSSADIIRMFT